MKIVITAVGTRGDVQPYVALGCGLQAAGHEVLLVSAHNEADFVRAHGLAFAGLSVDVRQIQRQGQPQGLGQGTGPLRFLLSHLRHQRQLKETMVRSLGEMWAACAGADLVIYHPGLPLGFFQAQAGRGLRSVLATPFPLLPTPQYPAMLFYRLPWRGAGLNRLTHGLFARMFWAMARGALAAFWRQQRPAPARPDWGVPAVAQHLRSGQLVLNGYSPRLFAPDAGWGPQVHTTGAWELPAPADFVPEPALAAFLAQGEPPLYIGFGSMRTADDFMPMLALLGEAVQRVGQRAVVALGWSQLPAGVEVPPQLCVIEGAPHSWLFRQVKLVVHHGGAGTVAAGLQAGCPTVVVAHHADQPAWGQRVFELGVGSRPLTRSKLTAERLADAIRFALRPEVVARAAALGEQLRQEDGVGRAVAAIEAAYGQE